MGRQTRLLLIASYMKFKDEFGKSHVTQQSIRSDFLARTRSIFRWLVRVVSDRSVRYSIMESTRHLAGKPEAASPNVGCFLRLLMLTSEDVC